KARARAEPLPHPEPSPLPSAEPCPLGRGSVTGSAGTVKVRVLRGRPAWRRPSAFPEPRALRPDVGHERAPVRKQRARAGGRLVRDPDGSVGVDRRSAVVAPPRDALL